MGNTLLNAALPCRPGDALAQADWAGTTWNAGGVGDMQLSLLGTMLRIDQRCKPGEQCEAGPGLNSASKIAEGSTQCYHY